ncbi:hypothetical protein [Thermosulfuriphilus sp.]
MKKVTNNVTRRIKCKLLPGNLTMRVVCPDCGNDTDFYEVAENVIMTTHYIQNEDGSFTPVSDDSQVIGEVRLYCGHCNADLTKYHRRFMEMLF